MLEVMPERFIPKRGEIYKNAGGGEFLCLESSLAPTMVNINSGWTFTAHVCARYEDGSIEWDYSTGGRFMKMNDIAITSALGGRA